MATQKGDEAPMNEEMHPTAKMASLSWPLDKYLSTSLRGVSLYRSFGWFSHHQWDINQVPGP